MLKMPQVEIPVQMHYSHKVAARTIFIPANTDLIGGLHKFSNLNILSQGEMLVTTEDGPMLVKAPFIVVSPPGTKRAARTLTDCVWTTIHGTESTDVDAIESEFVAKNEQEYLAFCETLKLQGE